MKKSLTLLLLAFASIGYAQIDIAIDSIDKPEYIQDGTDGNTLFDLQFTLKNNGTALSAGDTILYSWAILNEARTQVLVNATPQLFGLGGDVVTGSSFQSPTYNVTVNATIGNSIPISFAVLAYVYNRSTSPVDADSTDNTLFKSYIWEKQYGASVSNVSYNDDNIAVYPNPVSTELNIDLLFAQSNAVSIQLMDLNGKIVADNSTIIGLSPNNYTMGVANLENGLYILRVANGKSISTTKVTIAH
jgi:hypothetical protein